ncbi:hypothetical protein, partial [Hyphomonas sp.]|uniref:hypothetical protein n=1 Tax=Hyphomonas sp. TaxID=87 RepID=UPI0025C465BD
FLVQTLPFEGALAVLGRLTLQLIDDCVSVSNCLRIGRWIPAAYRRLEMCDAASSRNAVQ